MASSVLSGCGYVGFNKLSFRAYPPWGCTSLKTLRGTVSPGCPGCPGYRDQTSEFLNTPEFPTELPTYSDHSPVHIDGKDPIPLQTCSCGLLSGTALIRKHGGRVDGNKGLSLSRQSAARGAGLRVFVSFGSRIRVWLLFSPIPRGRGTVRTENHQDL